MFGYNTRRGGSTHPQLSMNEKMLVNVRIEECSIISFAASLSIPAMLETYNLRVGTMREELQSISI